MRITNGIIQQGSLAAVQHNLKRIHAAQQQVSSGLRMTRASDDPTGAGSAMRARGSLRALDQFRRGIQKADSRLMAEETALDQLGSTLSRARELAVSLGGDTAGTQGRKAGALEVEQLLRHAVALANTRLDDAYLFGGADAVRQPYAVTGDGASLDFTTTAPAGDALVEIAERQRVPTNHSGAEVFDDTGALGALRDLNRALHADDLDGVRAALTGLESAFSRVQSVLGETGARANLLQVTRANLDSLEINLATVRAETEEVDFEKAVTELVSRQTAFQAAMMATSRVMGLSLADYLR